MSSARLLTVYKSMNKTLIVAIILLGAIGFFLFRGSTPRLGNATLDGSYSYRNITSSNASSTAGVQVRGGAGVLGRITINRPDGATSLRVYDGTTATSSGTLIATIYGTSTLAAIGPETLDYEVAVLRGIVLDVPAAFVGDYTFSFK